jgi:cobalt-zinc-cadmium efflux system membrane fusion protein
VSLSAGSGCRDRGESGPQAPATQHKDEPAPHESLPTRVALSAEVAKAAGIRTQPVTAEALPATVEIVGEVAADPDRAARVTARIAGRIAAVHAREGDRVRAGTLLAVMESLDLLRTRAMLAAAQAREKSASENAARLSTLVPSGLAARQEVIGAAAESQALQAEASAAAQTLHTLGAEAGGSGGRLELRAPIDGVIVSRSATLGQSVDPMHVLFDLADLEHAHFIGRLFEKNLSRVQVGATAEVRLNAYPQQVFVGTVESIGRQLDPMARTVVARLRIRDTRGASLLRIGLFGVARITIPDEVRPESEPAEAPAIEPRDGGGERTRGGKKLVVPLSALSRITDRDVVFVRQPDGHFEVHPVTLGRTASGKVEILSGLRSGEQVVIDGVFTLKSALLRSTLAEED